MNQILSFGNKINQVLKRNNEVVPYEASKITGAIYKALRSCDMDDFKLAQSLTLDVQRMLLAKYPGRTIPAVEEIQDLVENVLMEKGLNNVAKSYILYRDQHSKIRKAKELLLDIQETMDGYLKQSDWRVNENSNVNYSLGGLILHNSGAITANYWLNNIYPKEIAQAHSNGDFHLHDLSMFSGYCAGWSLRQLLEDGINGVKDKISSRPAKHLSTAIMHMVNFLGTMQNEWAGAQAFSSFDTYLAPFVVADNLTYPEVRQCIQSFVFSMNTPSRWGSQSPFTNITLDWIVPDDMKDKKVKIAGEEKDFTYGDCQAAMDTINRAFLEVMMEGDANGRGFSYPIPTYNITRNFDWNSPNAKMLFKMASEYGTPYFQNFINSNLNPEDVRSMCCRLQLDKRELKSRGGGLFGADELTGSIGVVTINLPRIGYLSKTKEEFFKRLTDLMDKAKNSLEIKRDVVNKLMDIGLFPYTKKYLKNFNNHFSTIGLVGTNEACLNFLGKPIYEEEGKKFAEEILEFMRNKLADYQEQTGNLYNLEATPAEGTSYRLAKKDKELYPGITQAGNGEDTYYTNSTHLPVSFTEDIFTALDHQDALQTKYTGGTVLHGFIGESIKDPEVTKELVKKIAYGYKLPYFTITPTFSICTTHGRIAGEHFECPQCGKEAEVYSRIVGYYRPVQNWNKGKKAEFSDRHEYSVELSMKHEGNILSHELKVKPQSFMFFYSDTCPKCPPVKNFVKELNLEGNFINVFEPAGMKLAEELEIRNLPSVVFFDDKKNIVSKAHTILEVKECL